MMSSDFVQVAVLVSGTLTAGFAMQQRKYALQIETLKRKHSDELAVVEEKKKLAHAMVSSNQTALNRFEKGKDDLLERFDRLEKNVSILQSDFEYLQKVLPLTNELFQKVNHHFEARRAQASNLKEIAPDVVRVETKKE